MNLLTDGWKYLTAEQIPTVRKAFRELFELIAATHKGVIVRHTSVDGINGPTDLAVRNACDYWGMDEMTSIWGFGRAGSIFDAIDEPLLRGRLAAMKNLLGNRKLIIDCEPYGSMPPTHPLMPWKNKDVGDLCWKQMEDTAKRIPPAERADYYAPVGGSTVPWKLGSALHPLGRKITDWRFRYDPMPPNIVPTPRSDNECLLAFMVGDAQPNASGDRTWEVANYRAKLALLTGFDGCMTYTDPLHTLAVLKAVAAG